MKQFFHHLGHCPGVVVTLAWSGNDQIRLTKQKGSTLPAQVDPFIAPRARHQVIVHSSYLRKGYMGVELNAVEKRSDRATRLWNQDFLSL
jgi:hypothetical protein